MKQQRPPQIRIEQHDDTDDITDTDMDDESDIRSAQPSPFTQSQVCEGARSENNEG